MSKILIYTVTGFLAFDWRELQAGDQVDIPITAAVVGVPESIRGLVQLVTPNEVDGVEGRIYEIEYDEADLGGTLLEIDQCCDIGVPTAVTCCILISEHIALSPLQISELSDDDIPASITVRFPSQTAPTGSTRNAYIGADILAAELGATSGYSYKMVIDAVATTDEVANGKDSTAEFIFVGQLGGGGTINTRHKFVTSPDTLTAVRVGEGILVSYDNATPDDKQFWVEATLNLSKIPT